MADVPFMRPPVLDDTFRVGDIVEAYLRPRKRRLEN